MNVRWEKDSRGRAVLRAGTFVVEVGLRRQALLFVKTFGRDTRHVITFNGERQEAAARAVQYIKFLIAPFGGRLNVEGEP